MQGPKPQWYSDSSSESRFPSCENPELAAWHSRYLELLQEHFGRPGFHLQPVKVPVDSAVAKNHVARPERRDTYLRMLQAGDQLPAVFVERMPSGVMYVQDGSHRLDAARQHGAKYIDGYEAVPDDQPEPPPAATAVPVDSTGGLSKSEAEVAPEPPDHQRLPRRIRSALDAVRQPGVLTDDMRKPRYRGDPHPTRGQCYVAAETLAHLINASQTGWQFCHVHHEGDTHFFLRHQATRAILDPTWDQFRTAPPYADGRASGPLTGWNRRSKAADIALSRARSRLHKNELVVPEYNTVPSIVLKDDSVQQDPSLQLSKSHQAQLAREGRYSEFGIPQESLVKSIGDIPVGVLKSHNQQTGHQVYDYSHVLSAPARSQYRLLLRTEPSTKTMTAHVEPVQRQRSREPNAQIANLHGEEAGSGCAGMWTGNWRLRQPRAGSTGHPQGEISLEPWNVLVDDHHRGRGLGLAMYEAAYAHAHHVLGATRVQGGEHSTAASQVHRKLARRHGLDYEAVEQTESPWESETLRPVGDYDGRYEPYQYVLKSENGVYDGVDLFAEHELPAPLPAEGYRMHIAGFPGQDLAVVYRHGAIVGHVTSRDGQMLEKWAGGPLRPGLRDAAVRAIRAHHHGQTIHDGWSRAVSQPLVKSAPVPLGTGKKMLPVQPTQSSNAIHTQSAARPPGELGPAQGSNVTGPHQTYAEAAREKPMLPQGTTGHNQNLWARQSTEKSNADRTLMVQFSSGLLQGGRPPDQADDYYNKLYQKRAGYSRPADFWELPQWSAHLAASFPNSDHYTVRNPAEASEFIKQAGYKNVAFSALDVNRDFVRQLAQEQPQQKFAVGGPADPSFFQGLPNVQQHPTIQSFAESEGLPYNPGYDYRHFAGTPTIPRLTLSEGCLHKCSFCTIPRGVTEKSNEEVMQQVDQFAKHLNNSELVYLNDKTFGQAKNHQLLPEIYQRLKASNPNFKGFVIQTTAAQMRKMSPEFMKQAGIQHVELGLESFNDPILRATHKPATEAILEQAANRLREAKIGYIPNVVVGFPGETKETYQKTLDYLHRHRDIISHVNAYNLALYNDSELGQQMGAQTQQDRDENATQKSWMQDPKIHADFHQKLFDFGNEQLDRVPYQDLDSAPGMPQAGQEQNPNGGMVQA